MCRWLVYRGQPILLDDLLCKCDHSLVHQSHEKPFTPGEQPNPQRNHNVNGDGYGISWYETAVFYQYRTNRYLRFPEIAHAVAEPLKDSQTLPKYHRKPTLYKSLEPAWNDANLKEIAEAVISPLVFAHVRAATHGGIVNRSNCHPFRYGNFIFMHNGGIGCFTGEMGVRVRMYGLLPTFLREKIQGNTDSELVFALFLSLLPIPVSSDESNLPGRN